MATFVGVDSLDIAEHLHRLVFKLDAVSAHGLSGKLGDLATVASAFRLGHCNTANRHLRLVLVIHAGDLHAE